MKNLLNRILRIFGVIFIVQLCFLVVVASFALINTEGFTKVLAQQLVKEDTLEKSDAIVVIGGFENEKRLDYGAELFKQGYGSKMIVSGAGDESYITNYLTAEEIKKEDILIDKVAYTTYENAVYVKKLVDGNHIKSLILVTSPDQSKRARLYFDKIFKNSGIKILSSSIKDSEFKPEKILSSKNAKEQLVTEWVKMLEYTFKS